MLHFNVPFGQSIFFKQWLRCVTTFKYDFVSKLPSLFSWKVWFCQNSFLYLLMYTS